VCLIAVVGIAALSACTVDTAVLATGFFVCHGDNDCGDGFGCLRAQPYGPDFCAPICDPEDTSSCDGICTRVVDSTRYEGLCLHGCGISNDGTASGCPAPELSCVRTGSGSDGVCHSARGCSSSADCAAGDLCLTEPAATIRQFLDLDIEADHFYCLPGSEPPTAATPTGTCPDGTWPAHFPVGFDPVTRERIEKLGCVAGCSAVNPRCPPAFGCLVTRPIVTGVGQTYCVPGFYGVPCTDDSNCLFGRCLETGYGLRYCTETCNDAARLGSCERLVEPRVVGGTMRLVCDPSQNGGAEGGVCVPEFGIGGACSPTTASAYTCADGLTCHEGRSAMGLAVSFCTQPCTTAADCPALFLPLDPVMPSYECNDAPEGGRFCWPADRGFDDEL